jgi:ankyrin repeat protein
MQDAYGRTPLHVSATTGSLRYVDSIVQCQPSTVHAVDLWGNTPLDNAIQKDDTAAIAVLKRNGGLPGSHPDMQAKHAKVVEALKVQKAKSDRAWVSQALLNLPEEQVAKQLAAVMAAFQKFVQVCLPRLLPWTLPHCL